jgi:hypothetical protein
MLTCIPVSPAHSPYHQQADADPRPTSRPSRPVIALPGHRAVPGQLPVRTQRGESPMNDFDPAPELADLRRGWGDDYRITWNSDRFRATHIVSGQTLDARSAAGLRMLIRAHHSRWAAHPGLSPDASNGS